MIQYKHNCKYCGAEVERTFKKGNFICFNCKKYRNIVTRLKKQKKTKPLVKKKVVERKKYTYNNPFTKIPTTVKVFYPKSY